MKNRTSRIDKVVRLDSMSDIPDDLGNLLLIVGCPNPKWVVLECPCGCKSRIDVNLMRTRSPRWRLRVHLDRTVSLFPSLWVPLSQCGSHFWILKSRVRWVRTLRQRTFQWPSIFFKSH